MGKKNWEFIRILRAIGALSVVFYHLGYIFWVKQNVCATVELYHPIEFVSVPFWIDLNNNLTHFGINWGMFGVSLFFLISGFLIPNSIKRYGWKKFLVLRVMRLYPMYAITLLLTCIVLKFSSSHFNVEYPYTCSIFLKNLSLARDWFWSVSIDAVGWTLECEAKFYIFCAYIAWISSLENEKIFLNILGIGTVVNYLTVGIRNDFIQNCFNLYKFLYIIGNAIPFLCIMFIGVAYYCYCEEKWRKSKLITINCILVAFFGLNIKFNVPERALEYYVSYGIGIILFLSCYKFKEKFRENYILKYVANISFPLYLIHCVCGGICMRVLLDYTSNVYVVLVIAIGGCVLVATLLHIFIEEKLMCILQKMVGIKNNIKINFQQEHK